MSRHTSRLKIIRAIDAIEKSKQAVTVKSVAQVAGLSIPTVTNCYFMDAYVNRRKKKKYVPVQAPTIPVVEQKPTAPNPKDNPNVYNIPGYCNVVTIKFWDETEHTYECIIQTLEFLKKSIEEDLEDIKKSQPKESHD